MDELFGFSQAKHELAAYHYVRRKAWPDGWYLKLYMYEYVWHDGKDYKPSAHDRHACDWHLCWPDT